MASYFSHSWTFSQYFVALSCCQQNINLYTICRKMLWFKCNAQPSHCSLESKKGIRRLIGGPGYDFKNGSFIANQYLQLQFNSIQFNSSFQNIIKWFASFADGLVKISIVGKAIFLFRNWERFCSTTTLIFQMVSELRLTTEKVQNKEQ